MFLGLALSMTACGSTEKSRDIPEFVPLREAERDFAATLTHSDTVAVLELGQAIVDDILAGKPDSAFKRVVDPVTLEPIEGRRARNLARIYSGGFSEGRLEYFSFSLCSLNDLKYRLYTGNSDQALSIMFNPVKTSDGWVMGLKGESTPSKDQDKPLHPGTLIFVNTRISD